MSSILIRIFDIIISLLVLIITSPIILIFSTLIYFEDGYPIIFFGERVKKDLKTFKLYKLRSMKKKSSDELSLTLGSNDIRITKIGLIIRKYKIDELPQLINVLIGEMSLVGYRPESINVIKKVQGFKNLKKFNPGITDWASLFFVNEEEIISKIDEKEFFFLNSIVPQKIQLNMIFYENQLISEYFRILIFTFMTLFFNKNHSKKYLLKKYSNLIDNKFR